MRHRHIPCCALLLWLTATAIAQADQTDDFIRAEMRRQNIPGLSLVVLKNGEVIKSEGDGLANIRLKIPATPQTVNRIASVSKQFIATGIMVLVLLCHFAHRLTGLKRLVFADVGAARCKR